MATKEWLIEQYGTVNLEGRDHYLEDGDTWVDTETGEPFRGKGFDTAEVYHSGEGDDHFKSPMTLQGYAQTQIVADMMQEQGYNKQKSDGKGFYGRTLGVVTQEDTNQELANKMYSEGLTTPTGYTSKEDMDAYMKGAATRAMLGEEADEGYYGNLREVLNTSKMLDRVTPKGVAIDERAYASAPWAYNDVMYRHDDRTIDNKAISPFKSSFSSGMDSMQQGFWGAVEMAGVQFDSEYLEKVGGAGVESNQEEIYNSPSWTQDIATVDSFSKFGDWTAGALGGSLPYFLLMATGFIPGMQIPVGTSLATTFAGGTWNGMEGDNDKKSIGIAVSVGILMAALERLGGRAVLGIKNKLKKDAINGNLNKDVLDKAIQKAIKAQYKTLKDNFKSKAGKGERSGLSITGKVDADFELKARARWIIQNGLNSEAALFLKDIGNNRAIWQWYAGRVAKGAGVGFAGEATTETLQELSQYLGSFYGSEPGTFNYDQEYLNKTLINSALAGGVLGGGIHGTKTALTADSPISTKIRMMEWARTRDKTFKAERLLDMHEVLGRASKANVVDGKPELVKSEKVWDEEKKEYVVKDAEWVYPTNREENKTKVMSWVERFKATEKTKSTWARTKEVLSDTEFLSTRYNVLKHRLGEKGLLSPTFLSEMEYSGWVDGRATTGQTLKQIQQELEGKQHQDLRDTADGVRVALGLTDNHKNRIIAWQLLIDYKEATRDMEPLSEEMEAHKEVLNKGLRRITGHERHQQQFLVKVAVTPPGAEHYTLTNAHLDRKIVSEGKDEFVNILMDNYGLNAEEALAEYEKVSKAPDGYDHREYEATDFLSKKPSDLKNRKIDYNSDIFKDFQEKASYEGALIRATEVARFVSDMTALGYKGQGLHSRIIQIEKEFREVNGDEWTDANMPEIANSIINQHLAHRGDYHKIDNDTLRAINSNAGAMMALAYMPLALFASFPELGIALLGADRDMLIKVAKKAGKLGAQSMAAQMRRIANSEMLNTPEYDAAIKVMRERGMLAPDFAVGHIVDAEVSNERRNWLARAVMPAFYRWTGLTSFTTMVRVIRDSFGDDYINKHLNIVELALESREKVRNDKERIGWTATEADYDFDYQTINSIQRLQELGLDVVAIADKRRKLVARFLASDAYLEGISFLDWSEVEAANETKNIADAIALARTNFVDAALVNPNAGKRPLLYSDGRFRLLTIFQGYLSTFSATIIKPMLKKLAGQGSPAEQINAAMVMMTMIGLGFLGQALKDEMKYGDRPSWLTDAEYMQRGIQASGLMGQTERIFNLFFPLYHSKEDTVADKAWSEIGPLAGTIDSIGKGLDWSSQGEWERALNKFLKVAPGGVLTQQRKAIAEAIAGE